MSIVATLHIAVCGPTLHDVSLTHVDVQADVDALIAVLRNLASIYLAYDYKYIM